MATILSVQNKNFSGDGKRSLRKFLEPSEKPKVIYTDNSLEFGRILWRLITESPNFDTSSIRDERYCWKSGTQSKRRNVCCAAAVRLGWKMVGWFCGMLLLLVKCPRPPGRSEKQHMNGASENHLEAQSIPFVSILEHLPISSKDLSGLHQYGKKVSPGIFLGCTLDAGRIWRGNIMVADIWAAGKCRPLRNPCSKAQCKGSDNAKEWWKLHISNRTWNSNIVWRDHGVRESTLRPEQLVRREDLRENFKETRRSLNRQKQKMTLKPEETSGRYKGTSFIVITLNLEFSSMCRRKKTLPIPLKFTDVTRATHTNLLQETRTDDYWNVDVERKLSEWWNRIHEVQTIEWKASWRI